NLNDNDIVNLNIGGYQITTFKGTLSKCKNTKLYDLINQSNLINGKIFIDRNGKYIEYIINSLRQEKLILPEESHIRNVILEEMKELGVTEEHITRKVNVELLYNKAKECLNNNQLS